MAPRTNDNAPENEENNKSTGADAAAAGGKGEAGERVAAVRRAGAARRREGQRAPGETPARVIQPVRRLRTRPVQGRSGDLGAAAPSGVEGAEPLQDGTGGGGGGEKSPAQRITAIRRAATAARRSRTLHLTGCAALLAIALTAGSIAFGAASDNTNQSVETTSAVSPGLLAGGDLDAGITSLQAHLRAQPRDFTSWSTLGLAYVEQARTKGDPSRYPQADRAFQHSLSLEPDNDQALAGRAALAAARHDFEDALNYADQALKVNPYSERALCTRVDALVELGRYPEAAKAADTADDRRPGIPVFTRYAYVHELRGDVRTAERVLEQALSSAVTPGDIAYVATQLGQLAWNQGDYDTALTHYARALAADENYVPALEGRARAQAASGDRTGALKGLRDVVSRYPLPGPLVELGELYEATGDKVKADDQYALVDAWTALARANGVNADLDTALAAADHGDRASALRAARAEWKRRQTVHTADALAWALHVNGKDEEALPYARRATATGYRNAAFLHHRGIIERATGHTEDAREHLRAALRLNPGFSPLGAREARTALKDLEAAK
ncbi:tetratricopeptide repeat protein [Streptomyces sp. DT2A-34]|uniref:tetratricopeptide repeat protein n=1 Tax=Streptomyces sp. DT2A-34 TaxID=3051182 RepID=UPI00265BD3F6|nr:tetratricopeptide repeat protein [Streptomyces sp. DT2A-34]MDO0916099.1 tetratricopeptide repeat protein [Streptomyces sp. DT2A-34]